MRTLRRVLFWLHLAAGVVAGVSIAVMSATGVVLAFEEEIVAWAERDARRVAAPPGATAARLPLDELKKLVTAAQPELRAPAITLRRDASAAVLFAAGREGGVYANPYTGEVRQPRSTRMRDFMGAMLRWHRFLGFDGERRPLGKLINGACNLAFLFLSVSGIYLWWPRSWSWRGLRAVALLNWNLAGRSRDFNWHNSIGLWCAPVLIVLTATAVPISFRWGGNLVYQLAGEKPPAQGGPAAANPSPLAIAAPADGARPIGYEAVVSRVAAEFPSWTRVTVRSGGSGPRGQRAPRSGGGNEIGRAGDREAADGPGTAPPLVAVVREAGGWPRTASTTLTFDPFTGEVLHREAFADLSRGRQLRSWTRFLHTGQALGWGGQLAAGLASLGACFLVYTGLALTWRRFFGARTRRPAAGRSATETPPPEERQAGGKALSRPRP